MRSILKNILSYVLKILKKIVLIYNNNISLKPIKILHNHSLDVYYMYFKEEKEKCYNEFKKYFKTSTFIKSNNIKQYAIKKSFKNNNDSNLLYLEFGVWKGESINLLSKHTKKMYGFDSFEGLRDDWHGFSGVAQESFSLEKKLPKVNNNVELIPGWIEETLEKFLIEKKSSINFVNIDVDTYKTSKYILEKIKPLMVKDSIIIFDELYNYPGWDVGEYKALKEVFKEDEYKFLAFSSDGLEAVIQIIKT